VASRSQGEGDEARAAANLDLRQVRASLSAASQALSDEIQVEGIVPALGGAFAEDAIFLSPRMPFIEGAGAATNFLATNVIAPTAMQWEVVKADVSSDGTQGYTWTRGSFTIKLGGGPATSFGFFLIYWRRDAAAAWRVAGLAFNLRAPTPQAIPDGFGTPTTKHRRYFPNTDPGEQRSALLAADAAFAARSVSDGAGAAFGAFAAPDAVITSAGLFVFGPEAIGASRQRAPGDVLSWTPLLAGAAATGDLGFTVGNAVFFSGSSGTNFYSKYLTVWQKQDTGEWKYVADYGSSRPAP